MPIYMDFSGTNGAVGYLSDGEPVIPVGVHIHAMPVCIKQTERELYQQFAIANDVYFLFEDLTPAVDFYAVPYVDIAATDGSGGFIASAGEAFSLSDGVPLIYISPEKKCFLITQDSKQFLSIAHRWKEQLIPYDGVTLYASKEDAMADIPITDLVDTPEYRELLKQMEIK